MQTRRQAYIATKKTGENALPFCLLVTQTNIQTRRETKNPTRISFSMEAHGGSRIAHAGHVYHTRNETTNAVRRKQIRQHTHSTRIRASISVIIIIIAVPPNRATPFHFHRAQTGADGAALAVVAEAAATIWTTPQNEFISRTRASNCVCVWLYVQVDGMVGLVRFPSISCRDLPTCPGAMIHHHLPQRAHCVSVW